MTLKDKLVAQKIYVLLAAMFITSLVVSNLIFQKFFYWYPLDIEIFGTKLFEISVGVLPYPITFWSYVDDALFSTVLGNTAIAVGASMMAYLFAQFIDIEIYYFWKRLTKGKHLWLRNNCSTFLSQFVDTFTIVALLCSFNIISWDKFTGLVAAGFIFKGIIAILDTPFLYLGVFLFKKRFNLKTNEEIELF